MSPKTLSLLAAGAFITAGVASLVAAVTGQQTMFYGTAVAFLGVGAVFAARYRKTP